MDRFSEAGGVGVVLRFGWFYRPGAKASRANAIRLNWRMVVMVISWCRQSRSTIISSMGFCRPSVMGGCTLPNGTTKASFEPPQFWRRY